MNLNKRRATGTHINPMRPATKDDVVRACKAIGEPLTITKVNKGEWNESRQFTCGDIWLDGPSKGDRPNWQAMLDVLEGGKS